MILASQVPYFPIFSVYIQLSGISGHTEVSTYISKALKANMLLPPVHFGLQNLRTHFKSLLLLPLLFWNIIAEMENVLIQTHKKPAKQSRWKMLSYKETE